MRIRELGWFYVPASVVAWIVASAMVTFCLNVFVAVDRHSHSVSDTLYGVFPFWVGTFLLWNWIAGRSLGGGSAGRP